MDTAELAVIVSMQEDVSSQMPRVTNSLVQSKAAIRELSMGVMYMGSMFMGLSVAMEKSNNETVKNVGSMLAIAGGIAMAAGSAAQFVSAAARIVSALRAINLQLLIQNALSGPKGWLVLGGAVAAAGAAYYGMNKATGSSNQQVTIENKVVLDGRQIGSASKRQIILNQQRNGTSGIR